MSSQSDTRGRLIRVASALFRQRGYDGVGLTEILEASKAPKGSFYYHFPGGKEELGEAAIRYAGAEVAKLIEGSSAAAKSFADGPRIFAKALADGFEQSGFREGCPITSIALATVPKIGAHASAVQEVFDLWRDRILGHARRFDVALAETDADRLLLLVEGAWIMARVRQSKQPLLESVEVWLLSLAPAPNRDRNPA